MKLFLTLTLLLASVVAEAKKGDIDFWSP